MEYNGITADTFMLLAENRFRDSRDFYEAHKEEIKQGAIVPMRQIAGIIGGELLSLDPLMETVPTKMVSRIRRDTRYTHDKHLYRENVWVMFMRPKKQWQQYPCMWLEVFPGSYTYGIGLFGETPALMECFRTYIAQKPDEFRAAVGSALSVGAQVVGEQYKKEKPGAPEGLETFFKMKRLFITKHSTDISVLEDSRIIDELRESFAAFSPMYRFLLEVSDKYFSE